MATYAEMMLKGRDRRKAVYLRSTDLLRAAADYFTWCEEHPILEEDVSIWQGSVVRYDKRKTRAFTKKGLCSHLGITQPRFDKYAQINDNFADTVAIIEDVIFTQKFEQAAAGMLNAGIITRDLGLADKQEVGGIKDAPPLTIEIAPVTSGTFLPPAEVEET